MSGLKIGLDPKAAIGLREVPARLYDTVQTTSADSTGRCAALAMVLGRARSSSRQTTSASLPTPRRTDQIALRAGEVHACNTPTPGQ